MTDSPNHTPKHPPVHGRGATENPSGRFEKLTLAWEPDPDSYIAAETGKPEQIKTEVFHDATRTILARNNSPDVGFNVLDQSLSRLRTCAAFIAMRGLATNISASPPASISESKNFRQARCTRIAVCG